MKMSIEWHEESLGNIRRWITAEAKRVAQMQLELVKEEERVALYERQIKEAKRRGLPAFDRERLLKKRGKP